MNMVKNNYAELAYKAWPILASVAKTRAAITYKELGDKIGLHHRTVRWVLGPIQDYCLEQKLPPLTILVIDRATGKPGTGFIAWDTDDTKSGLQRVYDENWHSKENPFLFASRGETEISIARHLRDAPNDSGNIYATVKVRGIAQRIFRRLMLEVYDGECVFCGLSFKDALQAAHIIPWANASSSQRLDPRNGLLLCSTHHRLYDSGYLTVSESLKIVYYDSTESEGIYSAVDKRATVNLHGKKMKLPTRPDLAPCAEYIRAGNKNRKWRQHR